MNFQPFYPYLEQLADALKTGNATEHTHRSALKALVEALDPVVIATHEPKWIACGAPDYMVSWRMADALRKVNRCGFQRSQA